MPYTMNRLRQLREEKDLKQTTVAQETGLSRSTISNYEMGMMPSLENAIILSEYYNVSVDYLIGQSPERNSRSQTLTSSYAVLARLTEGNSPTSDDVGALIEAAVLYQCSGTPCGDRPVLAMRDYIRSLTACFNAAVKGDVMALADHANSATIAALEVARMPSEYVTRQGGK